MSEKLEEHLVEINLAGDRWVNATFSSFDEAIRMINAWLRDEASYPIPEHQTLFIQVTNKEAGEAGRSVGVWSEEQGWIVSGRGEEPPNG